MNAIIKLNRIILSILSVFIIQYSIAQENFISGKLIDLNDQEIDGYIDYQNWGKNPNEIYFKKNLEEPGQKYTAIDIKGFSVLDEVYVTANTEIELSPFKTSDLSYPGTGELELEKRTVFLQTMIEGPKSLYHYKDENGKDNFYIKMGSDYVLLVYKKYLTGSQGDHRVAENKKYLGQLTYYLKDYSQINSKIKSTKYLKTSLERLFQNYYSDNNLKIDFEKKTEKSVLEHGVIGGLTITSMKLESKNNTNISDPDFSNSINIAAGYFVNIVLPRNNGKWSVVNELMFSSYNISGTFKEEENANDFAIYKTKLGFSYLKLNQLVRVRYPFKENYIFFNAGLSNGFFINEKENNIIKETHLFSNVSTNEERGISEPKKYEFGMLGGVGFKFKQSSVEIRYEKGNGLTGDKNTKIRSIFQNLNSNVNRIFFLFKHQF